MTFAPSRLCAHGCDIANDEPCDHGCTDELDDRGPIDWPRFWKRQKPGDQWVCEPLIPRARSAHLYAPRGDGKSALLLAMGGGLATGRHTLDTPAGGGIVVAFVDREMTVDDLEERLVELGYGPDDDLSKLCYWIDPPFGQLDTELGGMKFVTWVVDTGAEVVFVDSITRCIAGEENDNDTYDRLYEHAIAPLKRAGIASVWSGNSGKDLERGSRGGSRKEDIMDVVWRLERGDEGAVILRNTKRRSNWIPERVDLQRIVDDDERVTYGTTNPSATLPAGSVEVAAVLDRLGADLEISSREAAKLLRDNDEGRRGEVVRGALKYRKWMASKLTETVGTHPRTHPPENNGTHPPDAGG